MPVIRKRIEPIPVLKRASRIIQDNNLTKNKPKTQYKKNDTEIMKELQKQRTLMGLSFFEGNYKDYNKARRAYFDLAVDNIDKVMRLPALTINGKPGIFSVISAGFKRLKFEFYDLFRRKTPNEILYKKRIKDEAANYISDNMNKLNINL